MIDKEEILNFLEWIDLNRGISLWYCNGYDEPSPLWAKKIEELIDDYIKSQEEE